jgi:hypothetical protein
MQCGRRPFLSGKDLPATARGFAAFERKVAAAGPDPWTDTRTSPASPTAVGEAFQRRPINAARRGNDRVTAATNA